MSKAWFVLLLAGLFEIGWPIGMKLAQEPRRVVVGIGIAIMCMAISGYLLYIAQKSIPVGTAYAVWTGIGAVGTFMVGVLFFHDTVGWLRFLGVCMIIGGVVALKAAG
jgi:quaternary ammonium compound-resistance protein SugE